MGLQVELQRAVIDLVVFDDSPNDLSYIFFVGQSLKKSGNPVQVCVGHIIIPTDARDGVFRLEHIGNGRVVHNDDVLHAPSKSGQVFHKSIVVERAVFSEKLVRTETFWIQLSHERFSILRKTCGEDHHFVVLTHSLKETGDSRSDQNVDLAYLAFDLNRQDDVSIFNWLELRVDKSLVQVEHQRLSSIV